MPIWRLETDLTRKHGNTSELDSSTGYAGAGTHDVVIGASFGPERPGTGGTR